MLFQAADMTRGLLTRR